MGLFHGGINRYPLVLGSASQWVHSERSKRRLRREYDVNGEDSWLSSWKRCSNGENARTVLVTTANANSKDMTVAVTVNPVRFSFTLFVDLRYSSACSMAVLADSQHRCHSSLA